MSQPMPVPRSIPEEYADLARTQLAVQERLLLVPTIVGVALGHKVTGGVDTGNLAIIVLVERKIPIAELPPEHVVPPAIQGIPTDVQEVGVVRAGPEPLAASTVTLTKRYRPAFGGVSVGHKDITAGTIATGCYDATPFPGVPPKFYILSNNHVLANSNAGQVGDAILQPGPFDGGTVENDQIATLSRFFEVKFLDGSANPPTNEIDAALAEVDLSELDRRIHWAGTMRRVIATPQVGMLLSKCGRTTGFTTGSIQNINATIDVNYGAGKTARFVGQLITTNMSAPGDSGSLIADLDGGVVGLLFAGSDLATVVNPIEAVQRLLGVKVADG